jgi:hypothetical protein
MPRMKTLGWASVLTPESVLAPRVVGQPQRLGAVEDVPSLDLLRVRRWENDQKSTSKRNAGAHPPRARRAFGHGDR